MSTFLVVCKWFLHSASIYIATTSMEGAEEQRGVHPWMKHWFWVRWEWAWWREIGMGSKWVRGPICGRPAVSGPGVLTASHNFKRNGLKLTTQIMTDVTAWGLRKRPFVVVPDGASGWSRLVVFCFCFARFCSMTSFWWTWILCVSTVPLMLIPSCMDRELPGANKAIVAVASITWAGE